MPSLAGTQRRNQNGHPNLRFEMKLVEKYSIGWEGRQWASVFF